MAASRRGSPERPAPGGPADRNGSGDLGPVSAAVVIDSLSVAKASFAQESYRSFTAWMETGGDLTEEALMFPTLPPTAPPPPSPRDHSIREAALRLEAGFLKEMLSAAGLGRPPAGLSGGAGEEQFASFLLDAQAERMARAGGLGLAESLFEALKARDEA